jgi:hypothetical protein
MAAVAPSDGAPAPWCAPVAAVQAGAPPSNDSARDALARSTNDSGFLGGSGLVLGQIRIGYGTI